MEDAPVPSGFQEVAVLQSIGTGTKANLEGVISGLQQQARELGCTVVVRVRIDQGGMRASGVGVAGITR